MKHVIALLLICSFLLSYHAPVDIAIAGAKTPHYIAKKQPQVISTSPSIMITGDKTFTTRTKDALALLKTKAPADYALVIASIGKIQQHTFSGMAAYETPPIYKVGAATSAASLTWYASTIVHDAYHSKLYHDYLTTHKRAVPNDAWTGMTAEMKCLEIQIKTLKRIGAPDAEIAYAQTLRGANWWDLNGDGTYDIEDEKLRDW